MDTSHDSYIYTLTDETIEIRLKEKTETIISLISVPMLDILSKLVVLIFSFSHAKDEEHAR